MFNLLTFDKVSLYETVSFVSSSSRVLYAMNVIMFTIQTTGTSFNFSIILPFCGCN